MQNSERAVSVTVDEFITIVCACDRVCVHVCVCRHVTAGACMCVFLRVQICAAVSVSTDAHICKRARVFCARYSKPISLFPTVY